MRARFAVALGALALTTGCGSNSDRSASAPQRDTGTAPASTTREKASPATVARATRAQRMEAVVRAWSRLLNAGDNRGVARLFRVPAVVEQGPYAFRLKTREQVALWHSNLPCSGKVVSITVEGRYATAVFVLGNRRTSRCDAPGGRAAARFEIVDGKIVSWMQVDVPSGGDDSGLTA